MDILELDYVQAISHGDSSSLPSLASTKKEPSHRLSGGFGLSYFSFFLPAVIGNYELSNTTSNSGKELGALNILGQVQTDSGVLPNADGIFSSVNFESEDQGFTLYSQSGGGRVGNGIFSFSSSSARRR